MNADKIKQPKVSVTLLDGKEHELVADLNALCELELAYKQFDKAIEDVFKGSFVALRYVMWALLLHEDLTVQEVGALIQPAMVAKLAGSIVEALQVSLPDAQKKSQATAVQE